MGDARPPLSASEKLTIETPELIALELPLAGIGSRFLALALDTLLQGAAMLVVAIPAAILTAGRTFWKEASNWVLALLVLALFLIQYAYFAVFEAMWNGQTPGKRRMGLRVIKDSGRPIGVYDALARNLIRIIDQIPGIYAVGIASALVSRRHKRLGDYVAGTVVVRERTLDEGSLDWAAAAAPAVRLSPHHVARLSEGELDLVEAFLARRSQLSEDVRWAMARRILERFAARLEVAPGTWVDRERLLEAVARERRRAGRYR